MELQNGTKFGRNSDSSSQTSSTGIFFGLVLILTAVVNIASNVLVLVILARNNRLRTCTNFFIANLSVVDLLAGIVLVPAAADSLFWTQQRQTNYDLVCEFYGFLHSLFGIATSLTVAVIALDRYHSILNCLQYEIIVTQRRTALVIAWIWLQAILISLCPLVGWGRFSLNPSQRCSSHLPDDNGFIFFKTASCVVLPYVITVFCYTRIHVVARRHARTIVNIQIRDARNRKLKSGVHLSASRKTVMVYVVLGVYTICWIPFYIANLLITVRPQAKLPGQFVLTATVLTLVNSACNPIMYALITSQFRNGMKRLYRRVRRSIFSGDVRHLTPAGPRGDSRSSWTFTRSSAKRFCATGQEPARPKLVLPDLNPVRAAIREEESSMNTGAPDNKLVVENPPDVYPLTLQVPNEQRHKSKKALIKASTEVDVKRNGWVGDE